MSEPKRYSDLDVWKALHFGENDSGWVKWEDYARLKAEVERLTQLNSTLALRYDATNSMLDGCAKTIEEMEAQVERLQSIHSIDSIGIEQLKAQVERLTKAGNALHAFLINYIVESRISSAYLNKLDDEWLAAKEVQS